MLGISQSASDIETSHLAMRNQDLCPLLNEFAVRDHIHLLTKNGRNTVGTQVGVGVSNLINELLFASGSLSALNLSVSACEIM